MMDELRMHLRGSATRKPTYDQLLITEGEPCAVQGTVHHERHYTGDDFIMLGVQCKFEGPRNGVMVYTIDGGDAVYDLITENHYMVQIPEQSKKRVARSCALCLGNGMRFTGDDHEDASGVAGLSNGELIEVTSATLKKLVPSRKFTSGFAHFDCLKAAETTSLFQQPDVMPAVLPHVMPAVLPHVMVEQPSIQIMRDARIKALSIKPTVPSTDPSSDPSTDSNKRKNDDEEPHDEPDDSDQEPEINPYQYRKPFKMNRVYDLTDDPDDPVDHYDPDANQHDLTVHHYDPDEFAPYDPDANQHDPDANQHDPDANQHEPHEFAPYDPDEFAEPNHDCHDFYK